MGESERLVPLGLDSSYHPSLSGEQGRMHGFPATEPCTAGSGVPIASGERTQKYYAVRRGIETGIYTSWPQCEQLVVGYKGAQYKSFRTLGEAKDFLAWKI